MGECHGGNDACVGIMDKLYAVDDDMISCLLKKFIFHHSNSISEFIILSYLLKRRNERSFWMK